MSRIAAALLIASRVKAREQLYSAEQRSQGNSPENSWAQKIQIFENPTKIFFAKIMKKVIFHHFLKSSNGVLKISLFMFWRCFLKDRVPQILDIPESQRKALWARASSQNHVSGVF